MHLDTPHVIDVIASGIHDVKNSLFDALARVYAARQAIRNDRAADALPALAETEHAMSTGAERLSKLLSAYRLARHENPVSMMPVELSGFLDDVIARVRYSRQDDVQIVLDRRGPDFWVFDRELIADCLVNAVQNALRHARQQVHLRVGDADGQLLLSVADNGPGFPDHLPSHADGTHSGVGLFIARRVAHLHRRHDVNGELLLGSDASLGGASFQLLLP